MDQKLQDELFEKHPKLFVNKDKNKWESCMSSKPSSFISTLNNWFCMWRETT